MARVHRTYGGVDVWMYREPTRAEEGLIRAALRMWQRGDLRRWHLRHANGGCCLDFPAELDELAVLQRAIVHYGGRDDVTVTLSDHPTGSHGWVRIRGMPHVSIVAVQETLL